MINLRIDIHGDHESEAAVLIMEFMKSTKLRAFMKSRKFRIEVGNVHKPFSLNVTVVDMIDG